MGTSSDPNVPVIMALLGAEKARGSVEHEGLSSRVAICGGLLIEAVIDVASTLGVTARHIINNGTNNIIIVRTLNKFRLLIRPNTSPEYKMIFPLILL